MRPYNLALAAVIIGLLAAPLAVLAASSSETYLDKFEDGNYSGSAGTIFWGPDWTEVGDDDSHTSGAVQVDGDDLCSSGECLQIESLLTLTAGAQRRAATSRFDTAHLSYSIGARSLPLVSLAGSVSVQVSEDGGNNWTTRQSYNVTTISGGPHSKSVDISGFASEGFVVRFLVTGLAGGTVLIDDVEIKGSETPVSTTSTSSTTSTTLLTTTVPTITLPSITTTTVRDTTTTSTQRSTTTTDPSTTSTTTSGPTTTSQDRQSPTSTTVAGTTTTSNDDDPTVVAAGPGEPPEGGGSDEISLYQATRGIQAGLSGALFADVALAPVLDPVDVDLNFGLFAEEIETSWLWMTLFGLVLTWALVSDLDRRRFKGLRARAPSRVVS